MTSVHIGNAGQVERTGSSLPVGDDRGGALNGLSVEHTATPADASQQRQSAASQPTQGRVKNLIGFWDGGAKSSAPISAGASDSSRRTHGRLTDDRLQLWQREEGSKPSAAKPTPTAPRPGADKQSDATVATPPHAAPDRAPENDLFYDPEPISDETLRELGYDIRPQDKVASQDAASDRGLENDLQAESGDSIPIGTGSVAGGQQAEFGQKFTMVPPQYALGIVDVDYEAPYALVSLPSSSPLQVDNDGDPGTPPGNNDVSHDPERIPDENWRELGVDIRPQDKAASQDAADAPGYRQNGKPVVIHPSQVQYFPVERQRHDLEAMTLDMLGKIADAIPELIESGSLASPSHECTGFLRALGKALGDASRSSGQGENGQGISKLVNDALASHLAGASASPAVSEFAGQNGDPLTDYTVKTVTDLVSRIADQIGGDDGDDDLGDLSDLGHLCRRGKTGDWELDIIELEDFLDDVVQNFPTPRAAMAKDAGGVLQDVDNTSAAAESASMENAEPVADAGPAADTEAAKAASAARTDAPAPPAAAPAATVVSQGAEKDERGLTRKMWGEWKSSFDNAGVVGKFLLLLLALFAAGATPLTVLIDGALGAVSGVARRLG